MAAGSSHNDQRPAKKRRRLADPIDEGSVPEAPSFEIATAPVATLKEQDGQAPQPVAHDEISHATATTVPAQKGTFDYETFQAVVGTAVPVSTIDKIRFSIGSDDLQRVVNAYFDGKWGADAPLSKVAEIPAEPPRPLSPVPASSPAGALKDGGSRARGRKQDEVLDACPARRYIGAFGVVAWATTSGSGLVKHGDSVQIERVKLRNISKRGRQKEDFLTRFTVRGRAVGRLPQESAAWVSTLVDQRICAFDGVCVFAPDRLTVNETIYLQLKCFLLDTAFKPPQLHLANERNGARFFETAETPEEKLLRQRQIALIKLFIEMNIEPTSVDRAAAERKKEDLLRAAQMADTSPRLNGQSPNGTAEEEEGSGSLEQDQLDALYSKAQAFDFNTPEAEPSQDFALELRKYQKQALHWMLAKEKDVKPQREMSMHPLWEEYTWPTQDMDDNPLPRVRGQDKFFVNPYSGELSLKFPAQEQHCLGGILADEMGLGKTIEMMSLIHSHKLDPAAVTQWVVAPMSLLAQWESEALHASKHGTIKVQVYYGDNRAVNLRKLCYDRGEAPDVLITSYGVVLSEFGDAQAGTLSNLFGLEFLRVILDEAHLIKNRNAKTSRACCGLNARHRWALTGTPIVNRLEDLYSLVRYLRVEPWSDFSFWRTFITVPFESKDFLRALNVVQTVLEPLVLRRNKNMKTPDGEALVPLPDRTINIDTIELSKTEREIYDLIFTRARRTFNENVAAGTLLKSYTTIFAQILRLRQV
ncbi:DNA helicase rad5, partial [Ascosphaera acerosa]